MLKLFPGPDREKRMRGDKADNLGVTQSQQQARLAGLALVFLNAALAAVGMVFVIHGFGSMNQNFHTWHAASILDLGLAFLLFAAGAWMVFEAFWPWLLRIPPEASWSHAWVDDGAGDPKAMVSQWCREVGYAVPVILELTWEANAGLDLQAALRGEIRIRLGMPLFLGLEKVQLRAVVMHELGHFGQRAYLGSVLRHQELGRRIAIGALFRGHPMWRGLSKAWPWVQQLGQNWMHALEVEADEFARTHCGETELVTAMLRLKVLECSRPWLREFCPTIFRLCFYRKRRHCKNRFRNR
jgi:hypothetical protein